MASPYTTSTLQSQLMSPFSSLSEEGGACGWEAGLATGSLRMLSSGVLCPSGRILSSLIEGFFCSLLQVGTSCEAKSQNSDESCQKISPLQRKQRKTTSWWGFPGEGKVKPSLLPSMCCLKMAVLQRENIFFPPEQRRLWCERSSMCTEHKDTDRPEAWLRMLFSQEFLSGQKAVWKEEEK